MTPTPADPLFLALDALTGRRAPPADPPETWQTYARFLLTARRRVLETPPCPTPLLRRAQGLFRERREASAAGPLRLVFDSWRALAPALRGSGRPRDLRYEGDTGALDLRVVYDRDAGARLHLAVEPSRPGLRAVVALPGRGHAHSVDLGSEGVGEVTLDKDAVEAVVIIHEGAREILRTPPMPGE